MIIVPFHIHMVKVNYINQKLDCLGYNIYLVVKILLFEILICTKNFL